MSLLLPDLNLDPHLSHPSPGGLSMLGYVTSFESFLRRVPELMAWYPSFWSPCAFVSLTAKPPHLPPTPRYPGSVCLVGRNERRGKGSQMDPRMKVVLRVWENKLG